MQQGAARGQLAIVHPFDSIQSMSDAYSTRLAENEICSRVRSWMVSARFDITIEMMHIRVRLR